MLLGLGTVPRMDGGEAMIQTDQTHALERLGFKVDYTADRLALATPTGPFPLSRALVKKHDRTDSLITRIDFSRWERELELERIAYLIMYPHGTHHLVSREQLLERQWYKTRNGRAYDVVFDIPLLKSGRALTLDDFSEDQDVQLGLDGSATLDPSAHRHLGFRQRDVLKHIAIWPSNSTEVGTFIHQQLQGGEGCGHYARDSKYASDYHGLGCCAEASSTGSQVARSLIDSLDLIEEGRRWKARDESW